MVLRAGKILSLGPPALRARTVAVGRLGFCRELGKGAMGGHRAARRPTRIQKTRLRSVLWSCAPAAAIPREAMQGESPGLGSEELQPPGWPERVTVAQVCGLSQGPRRSEHGEGPLLPWEGHRHSWASHGKRNREAGAGGQERDSRSALTQPSAGEREQGQAGSAGQCQSWAPNQATAEHIGQSQHRDGDWASESLAVGRELPRSPGVPGNDPVAA